MTEHLDDAAPDRGSIGTAVARAALTIAAITVLARVVGFARTVVLARTVGATFVGNTYATANSVPNVLFEIVAGGALASVVVPMLAGHVDRGDRATTRATASALLTWAVILLVPVWLVGSLLGRPIMRVLVAGVDDPAVRAEEVALGARMLVVFMPQVVLYGVGIVLTGVLQAHRRFAAPALAPLLSSVVVICAYLMFAAQEHGSGLDVSRSAELTLSVGTTLGVAVLSLSLVPSVRRLRLGLRPRLRLPAGVAGRVRALAVAGAVALIAQQVVLLVVLRLANPRPGGVVVFQLAYTVFLLPWAVLAVPIATGAFPALSSAAARRDNASYAATLTGAVRSVLLVTSLAAVALVAAAGPLAGLLLGTNTGVHVATAPELARAIATFAVGLPGYGLLALLTRALYARDDARGAAVATALGFAVVVVADLVAVRLLNDGWRIAALGIGNSLGMTVAGMLLLRRVRRWIPRSRARSPADVT